jgi:peptidoglycan-N-acetylglucosamine deacetylase
VRTRIGGTLALAALGTWVGYAWLPHLGPRAGIHRGPAARRQLALTFDDGPDPRWTPIVLDLLARHHVRASFFLVGERARRAPDVVRAIVGGGHEIGNHGWSHRSLWLCGPRQTRREILRSHDTLAALAGSPPRFFRPSWGMVNAALPAALRACGERAVRWSLQPEGLRPVSAGVQVARVLRGAHAGAIVDLHDAEGTPGAPARLVEALPRMIEGLRAVDYAFATVGELLVPPIGQPVTFANGAPPELPTGAGPGSAGSPGPRRGAGAGPGDRGASPDPWP